MGYDANGMAIAINPVQVSANEQDASTDAGSISDKNINSVSANKITAGILAAVTGVGDDSIVLDGVNKCIKIYDNASPANVAIYIAGGAA